MSTPMETTTGGKRIMNAKLLINIEIDDDIKNKYPNYKINYSSKKEFLINNIVTGFNHYKNEQEFDAGYEYFVVNELLETMESFIEIGDKVAFIKKSGYMGTTANTFFGTVVGIDNDTIKIKCLTTNATVTRNKEEVITIYDFLKAI